MKKIENTELEGIAEEEDEVEMEGSVQVKKTLKKTLQRSNSSFNKATSKEIKRAVQSKRAKFMNDNANYKTFDINVPKIEVQLLAVPPSPIIQQPQKWSLLASLGLAN